MSSRTPRTDTATLISRRLEDRNGRGPASDAHEARDLGSSGGPPADLLELHERWDVGEIDVRSRQRVLGRLLTRLRQAILRPVLPALERQRYADALSVRLISELWNRTQVLELAEERNRAQAETIRALDRRVAAMQRALDAPPPLDLDAAALVERFRGDPDAVRAHQRRYVDLFSGAEPVLDVGCGRGEFLELLREAGIPARGVDTDPRMVAGCRSKGLQAEQRDALAYLRQLEPQSLGGVFCAQLIEHLRARVVVELVRAARRALRPGGVIVLESVNPACLINLGSFYLDFTHERLYAAEAIAWLLESEGFAEVSLDFSLPVEDDHRLPRLGAATGDLLAVDRGFERLNADVYGSRAYAARAVAP